MNNILTLSIALNNQMKAQSGLFEYNSKLTKSQKADLESLLDKISHAMEIHRLNMLCFQDLYKYFSFSKVSKIKSISSIANIRALEIFINCQLEYRMSWLSLLTDQKIQDYLPQERIMIRKVNRNSSFFTTVLQDLGLEFPINFLNQNFNSSYFENQSETGFRILKIGFQMILCFFRCGFYNFKDLSTLLTFVR